jgi:hypothetical protein
MCRSARRTMRLARAIATMLGALTMMWGCRTLSVPAAEFEDYGPFIVRSDGIGQLSSGIYRIAVRTAGVLEVSYLASPQHCSNLKMHFLLDGVQKVVSDSQAEARATWTWVRWRPGITWWVYGPKELSAAATSGV